MLHRRLRSGSTRALLLSSLALGALLATGAANAAPVIGTSNVAPIEPAVPHPDETPCRVSLVTNATFGANSVPFAYAPPAGCPGPWAKIVLSTDLSLDAGRQFDRTASIWIGGVNVLFGTTAEPRAALAPSWHVERDLTDDTALLKSGQPGHVTIANYQTSVYTSTITVNATLLFYPATGRFPAPATPDLVIPLNSDPGAGTTDLADGTQSLSRSGVLPTNVEKARLDVLMQSQANDEFWYTCVPDALATQLQSCGGGSFREGQIAIDGVRAGVAPVYPWIYTGGIDPYLWEPIPGIQTLAFEPYSVELTPFAGAIDDGLSHTISLSVAGADQHFSVTGTLYLTLDHHSRSVRGAVTRNTLEAPAPVVTNSIVSIGQNASGTLLTTSSHEYSISGYAVTSHGVVQTTVDQRSRFSNSQTFSIVGAAYDQAIRQRTDTTSTVTTTGPNGATVALRTASYPLDLRTVYNVNADGTASQNTIVRQSLNQDRLVSRNGVPFEGERLRETVAPSDVLSFAADGSLVAHAGSGTARYVSGSSADGCVTRSETETNSVLTTATARLVCDLSGLLH